MKILIAADTYYPHVNGASYFAQRLAILLKQRGHEVLVIAPSRTFGYELFQQDGVTIRGLPSLPVLFYKNFRFTYPRGNYRLKKIIKEFAPDIIHIQSHFLVGRSVATVGKRLGIPIVGTNHFMPENLLHYVPMPSKGKSEVAKLAWKDFRRVFEPLDAITTPTETAAHLLLDTGFTKPVMALSCGINTAIFHPQHDTVRLREKYHVPNKPIFLYVGRLDKEKNVDVILRAMSRIPSEARPHFVVAGRGDEQKRLKALTAELNLEQDVTFTGFVPNEDLPALYCLADCFIIAGIAELQSLVTMEAMASGLPVIGVNAVALPELIHHEQNGYLFDITEEEKLSGYIQKITANKNLREQMSKESLNIIAKHDSQKIIEQYEKLYERVLAKK